MRGITRAQTRVTDWLSARLLKSAPSRRSSLIVFAKTFVIETAEFGGDRVNDRRNGLVAASHLRRQITHELRHLVAGQGQRRLGGPLPPPPG